MASWIGNSKIIVCAGGGGVGKTTVSAALGIKLARSGQRVLVLTVDPARRLADALGIKPSQGAQLVGRFGKGELSAEMVDPAKIFADFVRRFSTKPESAERLIANRLYKQLTSTISGSQEFTSLERLLQVSESGNYDLIILDTPPAQNASDFLRAPERIFALFQDSVIQWFIARGEVGVLRRVFQQGTRTVFNAFEKVTGQGFLTELSDFFSAAADVQTAVASRSIAVHRLLANSATSFVLITAFDEGKLKEALEFASDLSSSGHHLRATIINRARPDWLKQDSAAVSYAAADEGLQRLASFHNNLVGYYEAREHAYAEMLKRLNLQLAIIKVSEEKQMIDGIPGLERIADALGEEP